MSARASRAALLYADLRGFSAPSENKPSPPLVISALREACGRRSRTTWDDHQPWDSSPPPQVALPRQRLVREKQACEKWTLTKIGGGFNLGMIARRRWCRLVATKHAAKASRPHRGAGGEILSRCVGTFGWIVLRACLRGTVLNDRCERAARLSEPTMNFDFVQRLSNVLRSRHSSRYLGGIPSATRDCPAASRAADARGASAPQCRARCRTRPGRGGAHSQGT